MSQKQNGEVIDEAQSSYDKARKAAARRAADRNAQRREGKLGGRMERETYTSEAGARMHYKGYRANANEEVVNEEGADRLKDRRMERGGVDGNVDYSRPPATPNLAGKKKPNKGGPSALDIVKAQIRAKHGKGAIMDTKKK